MQKGVTGYILSDLADEDLEAIFNYTVLEFGVNQAVTYTNGFEDLFQALLCNPKMGRHRPEIRKGLYSLPYGSHVVFYRMDSHFLKVIRILHGSRDVTQFKET